MGKRKKEDVTSPRKKGRRNARQCYNISETVISVDGKENVFPVKLELQGESFESTY